MSTLAQYLSKLNESDSSKAIWVNPMNVNEFRVQERGIDDPWYFIGSLDVLSFGIQSISMTDAIVEVLKDGQLIYENRVVRFNPKTILLAWLCDQLDPNFIDFLNNEALLVMDSVSYREAEKYVAYIIEKIKAKV